MAAAADDETVLLLIGKTGYGKSSTGNAILGREAFNTSNATTSDTWIYAEESTRYNDQDVRVIDSPGLCDTRSTKEDARQKLLKEITKAIILCPEGFHALLLVVSFGARYTDEDKCVVRNLKTLFGPSFFKKFCIIIFSHGDQLEKQNQFGGDGKSESFKDWIERQKGDLADLVKECQGRCVLFYNLDMEKFNQQRDQLMGMVLKLKAGGSRYTSAMFEKVRKEREKFLAKLKAPLMRGRIQKDISLVQDTLYKLIRSLKGKDKYEEVKVELDVLHDDIQRLKSEINNADKGSGAFKDFHVQVMTLEHTVVRLKSETKLDCEREAAELQANAARLASVKSKMVAKENPGISKGLVDLMKNAAAIIIATAKSEEEGAKK